MNEGILSQQCNRYAFCFCTYTSPRKNTALKYLHQYPQSRERKYADAISIISCYERRSLNWNNFVKLELLVPNCETIESEETFSFPLIYHVKYLVRRKYSIKKVNFSQ